MIGLASFYLIGYSIGRYRAVYSGLKSFCIGRIGDVLFIVVVSVGLRDMSGSLCVLSIFGCYSAFYSNVVISSVVLIIAVTKSTAFGLHIWLPDAMEGPVPVSSLIHAATLVVSGCILCVMHGSLTMVYIICCSDYGLYIVSSTVYIALVVLSMWDTKRVVAYSTVYVIGFCVVSSVIVSG